MWKILRPHLSNILTGDIPTSSMTDRSDDAIDNENISGTM